MLPELGFYLVCALLLCGVIRLCLLKLTNSRNGNGL